MIANWKQKLLRILYQESLLARIVHGMENSNIKQKPMSVPVVKGQRSLKNRGEIRSLLVVKMAVDHRFPQRHV